MRAYRALLVLAFCFASCGPKETPEQRITRLRHAHQVQPTAVQVRQRPEGPELVLDCTVVNTARESLPTLTVKVVVVDAKGHDRAIHLVSLPTGDLRPGVASLVTGYIPGETLAPGEQVRVEVEGQVPESARSHYPEYRLGP